MLREEPVVLGREDPSRCSVWTTRRPWDEHPGSAPLPGHVDPELSVHESRLHHAIFTLQAQDHGIIVGGYRSENLSRFEIRRMLGRIVSICEASRAQGSGGLKPIAADIQALGTVTLLRFLGEIRRMADLRRKVMSRREKELLPEVCLMIASKFGDTRCFGLIDHVLDAAGIEEEARGRRKKEMAALECRVFEGIGYRVNTATPVMVLYQYIALAVARGSFTPGEMEPVGKLALEMAMHLLRGGRLENASSSEIAAAAAYSATLRTLGNAAACKMTTVAYLDFRIPKVRRMVSSLCPGTTGIFAGREPWEEEAESRRGSRGKGFARNVRYLLHGVTTIVRNKLESFRQQGRDPSSYTFGGEFGPNKMGKPRTQKKTRHEEAPVVCVRLGNVLRRCREGCKAKKAGGTPEAPSLL